MNGFYFYWEAVRASAHNECKKIVGPEDAPDVCSQVREACKNRVRDEWTEYQKWAYVKRVCKTKSLNWLAKRDKVSKAETEFLRRSEDGPLSVSAGNEESMKDRARQLLESNILSSEEFELLQFKMDRMKLSDIAEQKGYSLSTVKRRLNEVIEKVKSFLKDNNQD